MDSTYLILAVTMILMSGVILYIIKRQNMRVEKGWIQVVALLVILPSVMVLASEGHIDEEIISMLMGAAMGYFFRSSQVE